jgi:hypothetical protein
MRIRLNIVFYSQTNDQTKRQNQVLKQYFRCYVNYQQNDWTKWLSVVEFAYNNNWHSIIKISSFIIIFDEFLKWKQYQENDEIEISTTNLRIDYSEFLWEILYMSLKNASSDQVKYYDKKHILKSFNVKDKVLLNSKNIKTNKSSKKLNHKYLKSFEMKLSIDKQTYRLRLFKSFWSFHNVFHVFLLKSYRKRFEVTSFSSSTLLKDDEHFEIKSVLNSWIHYEKFEYLMKWLKWFDSENQWLKFEDINVDELIEQFHMQYSQKLDESKDHRFTKRLRAK